MGTLIFFYILFAILVGIYGNKKGVGFAGPFILSLILSPLIGFIITSVWKPNYKKKCPYCAEMIQKEAKVCKYCGKEQPIKKEIAKETIKLGDSNNKWLIFLITVPISLFPFLLLWFVTGNPWDGGLLFYLIGVIVLYIWMFVSD